MKQAPSIKNIFLLSLPVILTNAIVPLQGFVDIAVISQLDNKDYLNGLGFATQLFSLIFISFNFLQYATSGFSAQATGRSNQSQLINILIRSISIALLISIILLLLSPIIIYLATLFFAGPSSSMHAMREYFLIRIWGAPAELCMFVYIGWFSGQVKTRFLMLQQLVFVGCNILLSLLFVIGFDMQIQGVAIATVISSYIGLFSGAKLVKIRMKQLSISFKKTNWQHVFNLFDLLQVAKLNRDIFIRTMILTTSFAWIIRLAGQQGSTILSADIILLQILSFCAFALDGVAIVTEGLTGQAYSTRNLFLFRQVVKKTLITSATIAFLLSILIAITFPFYLHLMTQIDSVYQQANRDFYWCLFLPIISFLAYQFDGIFTGVTAQTEIRKAMIYTALIFFPSSYLLCYSLNNNGIWLSIYLLLSLRAFWLICFYPTIEQRIIKSS